MKIKNIHHRDGDDRATGKTFRRIAESLEQASAGNHVYYITNNPNMRIWSFNKMADLVQCFFDGHIEYEGTRYEGFTIKFPTGGFIKVMTKFDWNYRPVPSDVQRDYTIIEMWDCHD